MNISYIYSIKYIATGLLGLRSFNVEKVWIDKLVVCGFDALKANLSQEGIRGDLWFQIFAVASMASPDTDIQYGDHRRGWGIWHLQSPEVYRLSTKDFFRLWKPIQRTYQEETILLQCLVFANTFMQIATWRIKALQLCFSLCVYAVALLQTLLYSGTMWNMSCSCQSWRLSVNPWVQGWILMTEKKERQRHWFT